MMNNMLKAVGLVAAAMLLSACASMGLFKDSNSDQASVPTQQAPIAPGMTGPLNAAQIKSLLTGKSWRWKGPKNAGVTLYASDGTSLVEVTGKGTTQGKWETKDGQLCESFAPAPFLPQGVPLTCQPFTGDNGNYMVGQASFALAS